MKKTRVIYTRTSAQHVQWGKDKSCCDFFWIKRGIYKLFLFINKRKWIHFLQGAETWLKETSCELEMYLDPKRVVYNHLGLSRYVKKMHVKNRKNEITFTRILNILFYRSLSKVWNIGSVRYYAGKKAQGKPLPSIHKEDDPLQMGGDFTFRLVLMSSTYSMNIFILCSQMLRQIPCYVSSK